MTTNKVAMTTTSGSKTFEQEFQGIVSSVESAMGLSPGDSILLDGTVVRKADLTKVYLGGAAAGVGTWYVMSRQYNVSGWWKYLLAMTVASNVGMIAVGRMVEKKQ